MNNLLTAIMTKTTGSALSTTVGGRIYLDEARENVVLPYVVFSIVSSDQTKTFTEHYTTIHIEFALFSSDPGATQITTMYNNLQALFDECALTITGSTLVWMKEVNLTTTMDGKATTISGTYGVRRWLVDFEVLTSLN